MNRPSMWRSRWAAVGAAIAVSIGGGGVFIANAAGGTEGTTVMVEPVRILDTRDPVNVGLAGPFVSAVSLDLQVTGSVATTTGPKVVVPTGATGVLLNVTAVAPQANGFISVRPADAAGVPSTSSLNFDAGSVVPNAVIVALPTTGTTAGKIEITYDAYGAPGPTADVLVDVVGYTTEGKLTALQTEIDAIEAVNTAQQTAIDALTAKVAPLVNSVAAFAGGNQSLALGADQVVRSVSILPPANGTVIVNSSAYFSNTGAGDLVARCALTTGTTLDAAHLQLTTVPPSATAFTIVAGTRGFTVTSGVLLTVNYVCDVFSGAGSVADSSLTAIFAPT